MPPTTPPIPYEELHRDWPHVVVVGAGFAGLSAARALAHQKVRITIINRHNFHAFLPLLYQVATAGLEPADVAYPVRTIFGHQKNVKVRHATVSRIDRERNVVVLESGSEIPYDHLIVATGATAQYFGIPGAVEHAIPLYTLSNARQLRNHLLRSLEDAEVASEEGLTELNYVIVGGGPTGVETSGALSELIDVSVRRDGLRLNPDHVSIRLVDVAPRLLGPFPERASEYAKRVLEDKGVDVELGRSVVEVREDSITFADGQSIPTEVVIWAAGVTVNGTLAATLAEGGPSGRAVVGEDLRLVGSSNVWVVGDASAIPRPEGGYLPQLAPVAIQSGRHAAHNVRHVLDGKPTQPFAYKDKGIMATIGRRAAVAKLPGGLMLKGTVGWFSWLGLHLWYLVGFRNRLRVLINWAWRYLDLRSGPRIIIADPSPKAGPAPS